SQIPKSSMLRHGELVPMKLNGFAVLVALAEKSGKMVEKNKLMQKVWPDTAVKENKLTQNIYTLRKIFGERRNESRYIATVPGLGYRFVADVRRGAVLGGEGTMKESIEARVGIAESLEVKEGGPLMNPPMPASM